MKFPCVLVFGRIIVCVAWLTGSTGTGASLLAQAPATGFVPPRLKNGQPNFQGVWSGAPGSRGGDNTELFDGMEYLPAALETKRAVGARLGNDSLFFWCATASVPAAMLYPPFPFMIVQNNSYFLILHEYAHDVQIIPVDGSPHPDPKKYSGVGGDSRGHWEGDTLVVDVGNFSRGVRRMNMHGDFLDGNAHVVERYTLTDSETLRYEVTVEDPTVLAKPWKVSDNILRQPKDDWIFDTSCREGEQDLSHLTESPSYHAGDK